MTNLIIGNVYSGKDFNNLTKDKILVKLTVEDENHNGFQFQTGLNTDNVPFFPKYSCRPGGLYFCDMDNFPKYVRYNNKICINLRKVIIPDDAQVYIETNKYKTDKFILEEPIKIFEPVKMEFEDNELCLRAIKSYAFGLKYVKNQTNEICLEAVRINGKALQFVEYQTPEICLAAVSQNGYALRYVKNQTLEICLAAIRRNTAAL